MFTNYPRVACRGEAKDFKIKCDPKISKLCNDNCKPIECGVDEHVFDEKTCFWVDTSSKSYTWDTANERCKKRDMELASIHSQKEQNLINGVLGWSLIY